MQINVIFYETVLNFYAEKHKISLWKFLFEACMTKQKNKKIAQIFSARFYVRQIKVKFFLSRIYAHANRSFAYKLKTFCALPLFIPFSCMQGALSAVCGSDLQNR